MYSYTQSYSRDSVYTSRGRISSSIVLHSLIHGILSILAEVEYQVYSSTQCIYGILSSLAEVEYQVYSYTQSYSRDSVYTSRGRISSSIVLRSLIHGILFILTR